MGTTVRPADHAYTDTLVSKYQVRIQVLQERVRGLSVPADPKESRDLLSRVDALAKEGLSRAEAWALYRVKRELWSKTYGLRFFWLREICDRLHTFVLRVMEWAISFFKRYFPSFFIRAKKNEQTPTETQALGTFRGGAHSRLFDKPSPTRLFCTLSGLKELWERLEQGKVLKQGELIDEIIEKGIKQSEGLDFNQIQQQFSELIPDKEMEKAFEGLPLQKQIQQLSNKRRLAGAIWSIPEKEVPPFLFILFDGRKSPGVFYFGFLESDYPPSIRVASSYQAVWNVLKKQLGKEREQYTLAPVLVR